MLGLDLQTGITYEGYSTPEFPIWPNPAISQAKLILEDADRDHLPQSVTSSPFSLMFREDSFDAVTRVRRGRLYHGRGFNQPQLTVVRASPYDPEGIRAMATAREYKRELYCYAPYQDLLELKNQGRGLEIAIGSGSASIWRVVQTERLANRNVFVTLKAMTAFGLLPDINTTKIPSESLAAVAAAMDRATDSAYREIPTSVIDQCRNAANVVLSHWLVAQGHSREILKKDLQATLNLLGREEPVKSAIINAGFLINRLHPRGKSNEQEARGVRAPIEEDGLLAIQGLGFLLREVEWAL